MATASLRYTRVLCLPYKRKGLEILFMLVFLFYESNVLPGNT